MLTELSLTQYRAHAETRIPLQRFTVLIGPNAVGKSSVLEALWLLGKLYELPSPLVFEGKHALAHVVHRGATSEMKIEVQGTSNEAPWRAWITAPPDDRQSVRGDWVPRFDDAPRRPEPHRRVPGPLFQCPHGRETLQHTAKLQLSPARLAEPSTREDEVPVLNEDGFGLATVLTTLKVDSTDRFEELTRAARAIVPSLQAIRFKRTRIDRRSERQVEVDKQVVFIPRTDSVIADEIVLDFKDATDIPAHGASEGTLLVLGILATLYGPKAPHLLLLEDIERALHPKAHEALVAGLRMLLDSLPETQIVATSHSPYLIDALTPNEVVVLGRGAGGQVAARRLADNPKVKLLNVLTSGELWTAEGEDWVGET